MITGCIKEFQVWGILVTPPTVITLSASDIGPDSVILVGSITDTDGAVCILRGFDWGTTYSDFVITASGTFSPGAYTLATTGLKWDTIYYYRAKAYNIAGWGYGDIITFVTMPSGNTTRVRARQPDGGRFGINMR